jgi:hypothetical protein
MSELLQQEQWHGEPHRAPLFVVGPGRHALLLCAVRAAMISR